MSMEGTDDYLALSGIQHIAFCERQWALIHIEKQWEENTRTFGGQQMHERADDPFFTESRGTLFISRSVPVYSHILRLYGIVDVIEFVRNYENGNGVTIEGRDGIWQPNVVEYKYGKPKEHDADLIQLCAQAMCMEEMLNLSISSGNIYYGKNRHRIKVEFTLVLRERVRELTAKMYEYYVRNHTPLPVKKESCKNCSLVNLCIPKIKNRGNKVRNYINAALKEE